MKLERHVSVRNVYTTRLVTPLQRFARQKVDACSILCMGKPDFLLDLYGAEREVKIQNITFTIRVRGSIEGIPRSYHAKSQVIWWRTGGDIRGQSWPFGGSIISSMFDSACSQHA